MNLKKTLKNPNFYFMVAIELIFFIFMFFLVDIFNIYGNISASNDKYTPIFLLVAPIIIMGIMGLWGLLVVVIYLYGIQEELRNKKWFGKW